MENRFGKSCLFSLLFMAAVLMLTISVPAVDTHSDWKQVNTLNDLSNETVYGYAHLVKPGRYYLENNIETPDCFVVNNGEVTICLHGHNITSTGDIYTFMVRNGASLRIETCGSGDGELINSYDFGAAAVYLAEDSKFEVADGAVSCSYGDAIRIINGTVKLYNSNIETGSSGKSGVYIEHGSLNITGGRVKCYEYGINISQNGPVNITIQGALVTGFWGGICSSSVNSSYPIVVNVQEESDIQASNGDLPCIYIEPGNSQIKIADGKFVGLFKPGMNLKAAGGLYTSDSIKGYVADGYICRTRSDNYYTYKVEAKKTYTVIFYGRKRAYTENGLCPGG